MSGYFCVHEDGFILDGFPRTLDQAKWLLNVTSIDRIISISMRRDMLIRKAVGRRICSNCNGNFNIEHIDEPGFYMPAMLPSPTKAKGGKLPSVGGHLCCGVELTRREDDSLEVVGERLRLFDEQTAPVIDFFARKARDNSGRSREKCSGQHLSSRKKHASFFFESIDITGGSAVMNPVFEAAMGLHRNTHVMS
uniref:Adenylate kinase active site lid domain-containing protein n=1 Tax=Octactis speculum TaxID=3111310 RepID=A0A7S2HMT9_9STRA|mmetsp:Transcript_7803/g.9759  ORF Transcript_7803/g.9759 Transcript_7803/m.9759 type:complete len:194 (+) Transcript_7803:281-862(+)